MELRRQPRPHEEDGRSADWDNLPPALKIDVATGNQISSQAPAPPAGRQWETNDHDPGNARAPIRARQGNGQQRASTPPPTRRRNPLNRLR